ncbi:MAG: sorbosone dehydrogenase family protein [Candidatus Pseudobacter hemicellulosilyticus]|uniref:Sorbosone dehydrogenase family protein n=1 Tax=Candidatus Pseudobacter hemicellulosilyticus TaxID=3121375 RepID=A0AAJ6BDT1_9BACT|nr:MAG: sorbosone dehydrogenase family protein [Pseudobacter sp.]
MKTFFLAALAPCLLAAACKSKPNPGTGSGTDSDSATTATTKTATLSLPTPYATPSKTLFADVQGWSEGRTPQAPQGFTVTLFANKLDNPRWIYQAPNGDIFVAESATQKSLAQKAKDEVSGKTKSQAGSSANRITLFRDTDKDGQPDLRKEFAGNLNQPLGMLVLDNFFYVANTDGLVRYPYKAGQDKLTGNGQKVVELPAGGYNNHWTRNIITDASKSKIYISVGSGSNVAEHGMENEVRRANILVVNPDGSGEQIYASGLRNPVGMAWAPGSNTLWTAVNERDELGDELVPDYMTSVKEGGFYGWPYAYFGQHEDPRLKGQRPDLVKQTLVPDVPLGNHTASLGLAFYDQQAFPQRYRNGAFIGQHGSWNRSSFSGYKVVFVPFANGKPSGDAEDFLTGFLSAEGGNKVYGRPVGVTVLQDGSLLVADDAGNTIWRVTASKAP